MRYPVNINTIVSLKLTDFGKRILEQEEFQLSGFTPDDQGSVRLQLWEIMKIFGPHIRFGMSEIPFVNNEFILDIKEELK